jgi:hypothetical protein
MRVYEGIRGADGQFQVLAQTNGKDENGFPISKVPKWGMRIHSTNAKSCGFPYLTKNFAAWSSCPSISYLVTVLNERF